VPKGAKGRLPVVSRWVSTTDAQLLLPFVERRRFRSSFETFVLSTEINKHPALGSAGNASCRPKWSVDVDPVFQELIESSSVRKIEAVSSSDCWGSSASIPYQVGMKLALRVLLD
jgi:hypothetical protein